MDFDSVIGLEIHVQLKTNSKMFCLCSARIENMGANSSICPICSGQPGSLPVLNLKAVEIAVKTGLALNCRINDFSVFARKNYFYPDLPKGYQISQFDKPLCEDGHIELSSGKKVRIKRAHLEEDAGKSLHAIGSQELDHTLIDLNRCGIPLLEIVSEPDMSSPQEAYEYLVELKKILRWVDASNCDMEKGELRCDVNISLKPKGQSELGQKVEIKNLNSFKAVKDALAYEIERQKELCSRGERISQDTRLWNEKEQKTVFMRSKEMAHDYRYFPEPDLPPLKLKSEYIKEIKERIGLMPLELKKMYIEKYSLTSFEAESLSSDKDINLYFQKILNLNPDKKTLKNAINLITGVLFSKLNELKIKESEIEKSMPGEKLFEIAVLLSQNKISQSAAKKVFELCWDSEKKPSTIVQEEGLYQVNDDTEIEKWVKEAVEFNKKAYDDFKKGNEKASGPIVGYVMKKSKGKANPALVNEILKKI